MSKTYDICGLGNALVDIEIDLTDSDLKDLEIEKGMMTLIDENQLNNLLSHFPQEAFHKKACGGSAANTMIGATQFGAKCYYQCKVADDELGQFYIEDLVKNKIETHPYPSQGGDFLPTGICAVMITPDAERTMNSFLGITSTFSKHDLNPEAIAQSNYLYIEGYLAGSESGCDAAVEAKKMAQASNTKTVLTFSDPSMVTYCKANLEKMLAPEGVNILFCNETEATRFTDSQTIQDSIPKLLNLAKMVIITEGKDGATIATDCETIKIEGHPVKAIDTNGAGDLFAGVFLAGLTKNKSLELCGKEASFAAAQLVTQYGPRLDLIS